MIDDFICPLCKAEPLTRRYYENSDFWIADCVSCGVPMVVLKEHRTKVYPQEITEMLKVCDKLFNMENAEIDYTMRQIPNHFHFHIRPKSEPMPKDVEEEIDEEKETTED